MHVSAEGKAEILSHDKINEKGKKSQCSHHIRSWIMDVSLEYEQMTMNSMIALLMTESFSHLWLKTLQRS